jgi:hypothetical protein
MKTNRFLFTAGVMLAISFTPAVVFAQQEEQPQHTPQEHPQAHPPQEQQQPPPPQEYQQPPSQQQVYPPQQQVYPPPQQQYQYPSQQQVYPPQQQVYPPPQQQQVYPPPQQQHVSPPPTQQQQAECSCPETKSEGIKYGLRSGLNLSSIDADDHEFALGIQFGIVTDIGYKYFFFHPGIFLIGKGTTFSNTDKRTTGSGANANTITTSTEVTSGLWYIEAPLLLSFKPFSAFRINVGHYVSFGLFGTTEWKTSVKNSLASMQQNNSSNSDDEGSFEDTFDRFDFGLSVGIAIEIKQYYVGINYENSLINVGDDDAWGDEKVRNQSWVLNVGYNF